MLTRSNRIGGVQDMPRHSRVAALSPVSPDAAAPLVERGGFEASFEALVVFGNSDSIRTQLMEDVAFPLAGDVLAFLLLNQLLYRGAGRPTEMAEAIQTSRSNVSKVVGRLERAGLVVRAPDAADDRAVVIALTPAGREVGERVISTVGGMFEDAFSSWTARDRATLERLIIKLARDLDVASRRGVSAVSGVGLA